MNRLPAVDLLICLFCILMASCGGGGGSNSAPSVEAVQVSDLDGGDVVVGDVLQAHYIYSDADGDVEGATRFSWLREGVVLTDATSETYTVTSADIGASLSVTVEPIARSGELAGLAVQSAAVIARAYLGERLELPAFTSALTGATYPVYVYLPDGYAASQDVYPVLYGMDGETSFEPRADILDEQAREIIFIAIGSLITTDPDRRWVDYTAPGAFSYFEFLSLELLPYVESLYRIDPVNRGITGHSLGGLFATLAMLLDEPGDRLFSNVLVSDGTVSNQPEVTIQLEEELYGAGLPVAVRLFAGSSTQNGAYESYGSFLQLLASRNYVGLSINHLGYDTDHAGVRLPAFSDGLDYIYSR